MFFYVLNLFKICFEINFSKKKNYITKTIVHHYIVKKQNEFLQSDQGTLTLHSHVVYDYLL